jgi:hypothetical protein
MALLRVLLLLMLVASVGLFAAYAVTGQVRFRRIGLRVLITAIAVGFAFFAVLIADRMV